MKMKSVKLGHVNLVHTKMSSSDEMDDYTNPSFKVEYLIAVTEINNGNTINLLHGLLRNNNQKNRPSLKPVNSHGNH